jgi:hypothetical protein
MPVIEKDCSEIVDFAQTRKEYGLAGYVATQMIAYLNTNACNNFNTYFVGACPDLRQKHD